MCACCTARRFCNVWFFMLHYIFRFVLVIIPSVDKVVRMKLTNPFLGAIICLRCSHKSVVADYTPLYNTNHLQNHTKPTHRSYHKILYVY